MDTGLSPIEQHTNGYDQRAFADQTPSSEEERDNTSYQTTFRDIGGVFKVIITDEGNQGEELIKLEKMNIDYRHESGTLVIYNQYKAKLRQKYKVSFLSLPILALIFYYSLMQFIGAIKTGIFFFHPILSGGLFISSLFLIIVVIISAWQRDKLEAEIDKKIQAL